MRYLDRTLNPDHTPLAWLLEHLPHANRLDAFVGYLDTAGIRLIETLLLDLLDRGGHVNITVNHQDDRPRRNDLAWVLNRLANYGDRATISLVGDAATLHAKVFLLSAGDQRHALVGSANLTGAGLLRNFEACVALDPADDHAVLDDITQAAQTWARQAHRVDHAALDSIAHLGEAPGGRTVVFEDLLQPALDVVEAVGSQGGKMNGVPTGFVDLDRLLNGLRGGELVLLAGRPGIGKSTAALDIARNAAVSHQLPTLVMSFEMTSLELIYRVWSAEARVPLHAIRSGLLSDDDWTKFARRMGEINEAPLFLNDSCRPSIRPLVAEARRAIAEHDIKLIVIDYLQLLGVDRRVENRQQEITLISRELKLLARDTGVPVLAACQLNRSPEMRIDKRPLLSDLRESGSLEQDADVVILLHRDDYYDDESPRAGEADFIVAKHRNGPTDTVTVAAQLHFSRFVDMAL